MTSIFCSFNKLASPIPDNCNSWGVLKAPADKITSLEAPTNCTSLVCELPSYKESA